MYNVSYGRKEPIRSAVKQKEEMNPKVLPLDKLVQLIDKKLLAYYLEQISTFLASSKKDLWFPKISPNLDAFLVRVIKDVQNIKLLLDHFDENTKRFALQIIDLLIENEKVFHLIYSYECCKIDMNILVYKKIYFDKTAETVSTFSLEKMCSTNTANEESGSSDRRQAIPNSKIPSPPCYTSFKTQWLSVTLQFIKDSTQQNIEYPEMSYNEADFVYSLIQKDKLEDSNPLYVELWNALKVLLLTHDIKTSFLYVAGGRVQLSVEKRPHTNKKGDEISSPDVSQSSELYSESEMTKTQKILLQKKHLIERLDKTFINTVLKMIMEFITNKTESCLVFNNANEEQCVLLQCAYYITTMPRHVTKKHDIGYDMFAEETRQLLRAISEILNWNVSFDLKIDVAKMPKNSVLRTVSLKKEPKASLKCNRNQESHIDFQQGKALKTPKGKVNPQIVDKENEKSTDNIPKEPPRKTVKVEQTEPSKVDCNRNISNRKTHNVSQTIGVQTDTIDNTKDNEVKNETIGNKDKEQNNQLCGRKAKLLEDVSAPLESNINISSLDATQSSDSQKTKTQKTLFKKKVLIGRLDKIFINTALKMILDFISNETEASLVFNNANDDQCVFLQCACAMAKTQKAYAMFAEDTRELLRSISDGLSSNVLFDLRIDVAKMQRNSVFRTVSLKKEPKASLHCSSNHQSNIDFQQGKTLKATKVSISPQTVNKDIKKSTDNIPKEPPKKIEESKVDQSESTKMEHVSRTIAIQTDVNEVIKDNEIKKETVVKDNKEKEQNNRVCGRKAKLLEAMSVPLESNIAMRMMRQMGWHGGPLGTRGTGITEPIMPALNIAPGAGLGHVKVDKKKERKETCAYMELLQEIYLLLNQSKSERVILYSAPLTKKEKQFVKKILKSFSKRIRIETNDATEDIVDKILDCLAKSPGVQLDSQLSASRKTLTLIKIGEQTAPKLTPSETNFVHKNTIMCQAKQKRIDVPEPLNLEWVGDIGKFYSDSQSGVKSQIKLGHKIGILCNILNFFKEDSMETKMGFAYPLSKKQVRFLNEAVQGINEEVDTCFGSYIESYIVSEIQQLSVDFILSISIINRQHITFKKAIKPKISTDSAKEMCDIANNNNNIVDKNKKMDATEKKSDSKVNKAANLNKKEDKKVVTSNTNNTVEVSKKIKVINETKQSDVTLPGVPIKKDFVQNKLERDVKSLVKAALPKEIGESENDTINSASSKRSRSESGNLDEIFKKAKENKGIVFVRITSKDDKINMAKIKEFQTITSKKIDTASELPLIECHGIQNGALVYGCFNKTSVLFIDNVASEMSLKTTKTSELKEQNRPMVKIKLNSYVEVNLKNLFDKIERYNVGLSTDLWSVIDVETLGDFIVILLEIDDKSLNHIINAKLSLFAGIDKLRFSISWN